MVKINNFLDIGNKYLKLLVVSGKSNKENNLTKESYCLPVRGIFNNKIKNPTSFKKSLKKIIENSSINSSKELTEATLVLSHPEQKILHKIIEKNIPTNKKIIVDEEMIESIKEKAEDNIKRDNPLFSICETYLNSIEVDGNFIYELDESVLAKKNLKIHITFYLFPKKQIEHIKKIVEQEIEVTEVIPSFVSLSSILNEEDTEIGSVIIDIGYSNSYIYTWKNGKIFEIKNLDKGVLDIIESIALIESISIEDAEKIANLYCKDKEKIDKKLIPKIETKVREILKDIHKKLKEIDKDVYFPSGVIVIGGGKNFIKNNDDMFKEIIKLYPKDKEIRNIINMEKKIPINLFINVYSSYIHQKNNEKKIVKTKIFKNTFGNIFNFFKDIL